MHRSAVIRWLKIGVIGVCGAVAIAVAVVELRWESRTDWRRYREAPAPADRDMRIQERFLRDAPAEQRYRDLFLYFVDGAVRHASAGYARIQYAGAGSSGGFGMDGIEGFARTMPLFGAWLQSGRETTVTIDDGRSIDLIDVIRRGILNGSDPDSAEYWGDIDQRFDPRTIEAADIARVLWLTKSHIWEQLTAAQRSHLTQWLEGVNNVETRGNNSILNKVFVNVALAALTDSDDSAFLDAAHVAFEQYKERYLESGWFQDAEGVDYYNTWSIAYELLWIELVHPGFDGEFIPRVLDESAVLTAHLISPQGIPIMGRSICYRTAIPVPVIAASLLALPSDEEGRGLRALDVVWRYFVSRESLRNGALTQGYFGSDFRILDNYSGTGSCQWGVRSLIVAFLHAPEDRFWTGEQVPLPVERADYSLEFPKLGWRVTGDRASGEIVIEILGNRAQAGPLEPYTWLDRTYELLRRRPHRPNNFATKYLSRVYSSSNPYPDPRAASARPGISAESQE
jgi:hypothetical protein